jgi:pimeloyl-ACP methyl ester carboxylesterase
VAASGGLLLVAGYLYQSIAAAKECRTFPPPGKMIDVGGHKLHLLCKGHSDVTVVIEQGAGAPSFFWWSVQDRVAEFARVCVYDRAGLGWSDPVPGPRSIEDRVADLYRLLVNAQVPGPYILVAHSYGGLIVRSFTLDHRDKVAGLVLVDTGDEGMFSHRDVVSTYSKLAFASKALGYAARFGILRVVRLPFLRGNVAGLPPAVRKAAAAVCLRPHNFFAAADDIASILKRSRSWQNQQDGSGTLGNLPVTVITHGRPFPGPFSVLEKYWNEGQRRLASLSAKSVLIVAEKSNHMIQDDEPDIVVNAIRRLALTACDDSSGDNRDEATSSAGNLLSTHNSDWGL